MMPAKKISNPNNFPILKYPLTLNKAVTLQVLTETKKFVKKILEDI
jgi:hypothetical protein